MKSTYCSDMASMTLRHPSSDMAATYFTSGENTKSCGERVRLTCFRITGWHLTDDLSMGDSPVTHRILGHLFLFSLIRLVSRHDGMPRGHSDDDVVRGIPLMRFIRWRYKCAVFAFLVICNDGAIGVRDEEKSRRRRNPADCGAWRVGYAALAFGVLVANHHHEAGSHTCLFRRPYREDMGSNEE